MQCITEFKSEHFKNLCLIVVNVTIATNTNILYDPPQSLSHILEIHITYMIISVTHYYHMCIFTNFARAVSFIIPAKQYSNQVLNGVEFNIPTSCKCLYK